MTEATWRTCSDMRRMVAVLGERASERKGRLCAVALAKSILSRKETDREVAPRVLAWLTDASRYLPALEAAEQYADRRIGKQELRAARRNGTGGPHNVYRLCAAADT